MRVEVTLKGGEVCKIVEGAFNEERLLEEFTKDDGDLVLVSCEVVGEDEVQRWVRMGEVINIMTFQSIPQPIKKEDAEEG